MLAKISAPTSDFKALARYLILGKERPPNAKRVAWTDRRNLPFDDAELAALLMQATAALSQRCEKPVYHLMINWRPDERPSPEMMREIAQKTLVLAGLAEHQAFLVGHGDTHHPHLHMMINRVHPETGRAWDTKHDYQRFDRIMKQLADEHGFDHAPCHRFDPDATADLPRGPKTRSYRAAMRGSIPWRKHWSSNEADDYGARLSEHLDQASTLEDLAHLAAEDGLTLERKGTGYALTNATSSVKLSALGLQHTAQGLRKQRTTRRGVVSRPTSPAPVRTPPLIDAVDIARALTGMGLAERTAVRDAVLEAKAKRALWMAKRPVLEQLLDDMTLPWQASTAIRAPSARRPRAQAPPTPHSRRGDGRGR